VIHVNLNARTEKRVPDSRTQQCIVYSYIYTDMASGSFSCNFIRKNLTSMIYASRSLSWLPFPFCVITIKIILYFSPWLIKNSGTATQNRARPLSPAIHTITTPVLSALFCYLTTRSTAKTTWRRW
jgi:hypothetical protein